MIENSVGNLRGGEVCDVDGQPVGVAGVENLLGGIAFWRFRIVFFHTDSPVFRRDAFYMLIHIRKHKPDRNEQGLPLTGGGFYFSVVTEIARVVFDQVIGEDKAVFRRGDVHHRIENNVPYSCHVIPDIFRQFCFAVRVDKAEDRVVDEMIVNQAKICSPYKLLRNRVFSRTRETDQINDNVLDVIHS